MSYETLRKSPPKKGTARSNADTVSISGKSSFNPCLSRKPNILHPQKKTFLSPKHAKLNDS